MDSRTDEEIAALVQTGDQTVFGQFVERYEEKLMRYAKKFIPDQDDAKDIVQEIFIKAYTNIKSFDAKRKFSPWIYRIAHNEFLNSIKKRQSHPTISLDIFELDTILPHPIAKEDSELEAERKETKELMDKVLAKLSDKYREALVLYYFEDMGYGEMAEVLGIPVSTVGIRLRRGREMMRKEIEKVK